MLQSHEWITNCIKSCNNHWQLRTCHTLLDLFRQQYKNEKEMERLASAIEEAILSKEPSIEVGI